MKHLPKHPKQQRMEDMTFPLQKNKPSPVFVRMGDKIIPYRGKSGNKKGTNIVSNKSPDIAIFVDTNLDSHTYINNKKVTFPITKMGKKMNKIIYTALDKKKLDKLGRQAGLSLDKLLEEENKMRKVFKEDITDKVVWEGREWLRSINDDRHGWHVLGWVILGVAVIISLKIVL